LQWRSSLYMRLKHLYGNSSGMLSDDQLQALICQRIDLQTDFVAG
jgi:hypothetical protein